MTWNITSILSIENHQEEGNKMKTLLFSFLAVCALSTSYASQPDTYNVDKAGSVSVGDKKDVAISKVDISVTDVKRDTNMRDTTSYGGRRGR